jgi:hypothetical protein
MYTQFIWSHVQDEFEAATTLKLIICILLNNRTKINVVGSKYVFNMRLYKLLIRCNMSNSRVFERRRVATFLYSYSECEVKFTCFVFIHGHCPFVLEFTSTFFDFKYISKYTTLMRTLGITSSSLSRLSWWLAFLASTKMRGWLYSLIRRCIRRMGTHILLYLWLTYHSDMRDIGPVTPHMVDFDMGSEESL